MCVCTHVHIYAFSALTQLAGHHLGVYIRLACNNWVMRCCAVICLQPDADGPADATHARLTALFPGLPRWAGTRKVKPIWILLKQETVSGSSIRWAMCKSAPRSREITMPTPHHSVFTGWMLFLPPNQQCQSTEGKVQLMPMHPKTSPSLASFKSKLVLPFWYQLTQVVLKKRLLNRRSSTTYVTMSVFYTVCHFIQPHKCKTKSGWLIDLSNLVCCLCVFSGSVVW